jgi:aromatic-L-amino-acid decarboxylase
LGHIPSSGLYHGAMGDTLASICNKFSGDVAASPGAVRLENIVLRWCAQLIGYDTNKSAGVHLSGASVATITVLTCAREHLYSRMEEAIDRTRDIVVYYTELTHHCVTKALFICGMSRIQHRMIAVDERYRMRSDSLTTAIEEDSKAGRIPWLVVATAGSTSTGSVDPIDDIATIVQRHNLWLHVDAAYGGFFTLTDHGRTIMKVTYVIVIRAAPSR